MQKIYICKTPFFKVLAKFFENKIPFKYVVENGFIKLLVDDKIYIFQN